MGSLGSRPKIPSYTPPAYTPPPAPAPEPEETAEQKAAQQRKQNLLQRSRGQFGTVLTSFRGLLGLNAAPARKTLLGE